MKVFISHASANKDVVMKFADLLREVSGNEIQVFCSSEAGTIRVGKDFVDVILTELRQSDLFIPIISKEYTKAVFVWLNSESRVRITMMKPEIKNMIISIHSLSFLSDGHMLCLGPPFRIYKPMN